jgi:riboflavin biosynthesis pyrimidine reductase/predicted DsbA family dithiol-disulfide isomerase
MPQTVSVAHDFICPWCWIGLFQAKRLQREFGVKIDWQGYELWPESLVWPESKPAEESPTNKPETPSRLSFLLMAEGLSIPQLDRPKRMRTNNAHQAAIFAKLEGVQDEFIEAIYRAYWERGMEINSPEVLCEIAKGIVSDVDGMLKAVAENRFDDQVTDFDEPAHAKGVYNVPTFFVGEQRLAEQPYGVIRKAMVAHLDSPTHTDLYQDLEFSTRYEHRPYVFCNMVSTIDGKIITGERDEAVHDLGSATDHLVMHRLESKADAILVGAHSLRATGINWDPKTEIRIVVTQSGDVPWTSDFLRNGRPIVLTTRSSTFDAPDHVLVIRAGENKIDWNFALKELKKMGVNVLNLLGGSETNASFLRMQLVDELFLTLAPKVKLGGATPTYADGSPLRRDEVQTYRLLSSVTVGQEIFLRYGRP